ncbi:MAG: hypothetical protein Q8P18_22860 [Pseudomonadota bacterium]|nr:hypothetical protein [Pseudomonadota bacterium]
MSALEAWLGGLRDWVDADGRPLGERASPLYPPDTRRVACPYAGSREGRPMNVTSLAQVRPHRERNLATLAAACGPSPTVARLLQGCSALVALPVASRLASPDAPIPVEVAALYKTTIGFHQLLVSLLLDTEALAGTPAAELDGAEALLAALEAGGWLVGQVEVCAGAPADIAATWDVLTGRRPAPAVEPYPTGLGPWATEATGLGVALVLATADLLTRGNREGLDGFGAPEPPVAEWPLGARLWRQRPTPWLVAATARADRTAALAPRLFEVCPASVTRFVEEAPRVRDHRELEVLFRSVAEGVSGR